MEAYILKQILDYLIITEEIESLRAQKDRAVRSHLYEEAVKYRDEEKFLIVKRATLPSWKELRSKLK